MKKLFAIAILSLSLISTTGTAYAANNISGMAVNKGGKAVAECAKMMDKGVSHCVTTTCDMMQ